MEGWSIYDDPSPVKAREVLSLEFFDDRPSRRRLAIASGNAQNARLKKLPINEKPFDI
jgi:hypothetical protein